MTTELLTPTRRPSDAASPLARVWRECFASWPQGVDRNGIVVATWDEQIPFRGFAVADTLVYLERRNPDSLGSRAVMVPYENIAALKIVDVVDVSSFASMGFQTKPARPQR